MKQAKKSTRRAPASGPARGVERRRDLLDAAYALIAERGLEGLRTRDIAARAGVNISTLHYYFGTKEALIVALIEHVSDVFAAAQAEQAARVLRGEPALRAHIEAAWLSFQATPHLSIVLQELALRAHRDATSRAAFRLMHRKWNQAVEDTLRAAIVRGELRADLDPRAGARIITSFLIGATVQLGVNPRAFDAAEIARELERWATARG